MEREHPVRIGRRLAAIVAADVAGYSRLMGLDEVGTARTLREHRKVTDALVEKHGGRLVKSTGDGVLLEFASVVDAVEYAVAVQEVMAQRNEGVPVDRRMLFRIGINLGDILIEGDDILGDGVNVAARLEGIAEPGGICVSSSAYDQVQGKVGVEFTDLGDQHLKNISRPIRAFAVNRGRTETSEATSHTHQSTPPLSLVVLPFANIGGDPDQEYFVDGVTESLTTDLSRIAGAFVIARNTAFTFKGKAVDVKKLGRELNIRYVLEGSVQRGGNRLRINVQLIDAATGNHLWADRFDKPVADIFDMQDEIVSRLANELDAQFIEAEARRAQRVSNPDAMDHYFRGVAALYKGQTLEYANEAQRAFESGLALYPDNVDLLVGVAVVNAQKALNSFVDDRVSHLVAAEAALTNAVSRAPNHAYGHLFLALVYNVTNRASQGIAECERALALNRNLALAHAYMAHAKIFLGRSTEVEADVKEALRLSPRDISAYSWFQFIGMAKIHLSEYGEAVEWLQRSVEANRSYPFAHFLLASALAFLGRLEEAQRAVQEGLSFNPGFTIRRLRSYVPSSNPVFLDGFNRTCDGLLLAGVPVA
jgi:TolB-like protein/cytochrome c-type biogenesis protein CcmH/NrfG